ncbi:MAG: hypothetical protein K9L78_00975 [Victivallales bacterium]|nr:hypothetical protein [Victivallales bacterium]MCF7888669.1 hypothetical protein [Victivallales bacterium]
MESNLCDIQETKHVSNRIKNIGIYNWLAIAWALYWRNIIVSIITFLCISILTILFALTKPGITGLIIFGGSISILFFLFAYSRLIKWFLKVEYNGFKIGIVDVSEKSKIDFRSLASKSKYGFAWALLWRNIVLTLLAFLSLVAVQMVLSAVLYITGGINLFIQIIPGTGITYLEMFYNSWEYYVYFLFFIFTTMWFLKVKSRDFQFALIEDPENSLKKRRHGLLSFLLFCIIIGNFLNSLLYFHWEKVRSLFFENFILQIPVEILYVSMALTLLISFSALLIWFWKKIGLYLYLILITVFILLNLFYINFAVFFMAPSIISTILVFYLCRKQWDNFD